MTDTEYRPPSDLTDSELEAIALDREPSSIRDLQYLYGGLYQLGVDTADWPIEDKYAPHLTPGVVKDLVGTPNSLVFIDIQIDADARSVTPLGVSATALDEWYLQRIAYAHYDASRGVDHSITQRTGENTPEKVANFHLERVLEKWSGEDGVSDIVDAHQDGWLINALAEIPGTDAMDGLQSQALQELDGEQHRLVSARFTTAPQTDYDSITGVPREDWTYPADWEVLSEALVERRKHKWESKNDANARGSGAGYVLGGDTDTFGMTPDPLNLFTGKKRAWMPRFDRDEAANIHPISPDAATYIEYSGEFTDVAYRKVNGGRFYHLPYLRGEQTPEKLRSLYALLWNARTVQNQKDADDRNATIEMFYRTAAENPTISENIINNLAFWSLYLTYGGTATRVRTMAEVRGSDIIQHVDVADIADGVATQLADDAYLRTSDEMPFANPSTNKLQYVSKPGYFLNTVPSPPSDEDDKNTNSPAFVFYQKLLSGTSISLVRLLQAYVDKLDEEYDPTDDRYPLPTWRLTEQYAQLQTLQQADLLTVDIPRTPESPTSPTSTRPMTDAPSTPANRAAAESQAYREFIDNHALLADHTERRAAFTLGVLITTIAGYQRSEGKNPLTASLGPKSITKQNFKTHTTDLLDLVNTYGAENNQVMRYHELTGQLSDDLSHADPTNWELATADIQWHISLGMGFGAQYHGSHADATDSEPTTAETDD